MSADGTVVVGLLATYGPAFRWTAGTGVVDIGSISTKVAISRDGRTIVGKARAADRLAYASIWQSGKQWMALPPPEGWRDQDGTVTGAYDVSADGSVIVGLAYLTRERVEAFRYHVSTGTVTLGTLTGGYTRASAVSGDGRVVAGWDDLKGKGAGLGRWFGTVWWEGSERLLHPFNAIGQVEGANDVGSILVGRGHPLNFLHAFRYTSWDGHVEDLGAIKRTSGGDGVGNPIVGAEDLEDSSIALAVSDDGNVVVGTSGWEPPTDAFIWTPQTKILKLGDYLTSKGITGHENWRLMTAVAVSPNGKIIAGSGINNANQRVEGYVVRIP
jgi:probable HAF family extracellular repeat protein